MLHSQAHHDSYYPDQWLVVRWLCPKHHRVWHLESEPIWPTIYEFHPSDEKPARQRRGTYIGPSGRMPRPWFHKHRMAWYANVRKKRYRLSTDYAEAVEKLNKLIEGGE